MPVICPSLLSLGRVIALIPVGFDGHTLALSPDSSQVHVANSGNNDVTIIDAATRQALQTYGVGQGPHGILFYRTDRKSTRRTSPATR